MPFRKLVERQFPRVHRPARAVAICCSDRRIKGSRGLFGETVGICKSDAPPPIIIPGGVKDIAYPKHPRDRDHILEWIALLGGEKAEAIIAGAHNECLACGKCTDLAFYEDMLGEAGKVLKGRFPQAKILFNFVDFDGLYCPDSVDGMLVNAYA